MNNLLYIVCIVVGALYSLSLLVESLTIWVLENREENDVFDY